MEWAVQISGCCFHLSDYALQALILMIFNDFFLHTRCSSSWAYRLIQITSLLLQTHDLYLSITWKHVFVFVPFFSEKVTPILPLRVFWVIKGQISRGMYKISGNLLPGKSYVWSSDHPSSSQWCFALHNKNITSN